MQSFPLKKNCFALANFVFAVCLLLYSLPLNFLDYTTWNILQRNGSSKNWPSEAHNLATVGCKSEAMVQKIAACSGRRRLSLLGAAIVISLKLLSLRII
jgi:hypothetical protein